VLILGSPGFAQDHPSEEARLSAARKAFDAGHWEEAANLARGPADQSPDLDFLLGLALARQEKWSEAQMAFEAGLRKRREIRDSLSSWPALHTSKEIFEPRKTACAWRFGLIRKMRTRANSLPPSIFWKAIWKRRSNTGIPKTSRGCEALRLCRRLDSNNRSGTVRSPSTLRKS